MFSRFQRSPSPLVFMPRLSEHTSVIDRGRNRGGSKLDFSFVWTTANERHVHRCTGYQTLCCFQEGCTFFLPPPMHFSLRPPLLLFPGAKAEPGDGKKGSVTSLFHFPFARKCIKSALFPLGAETPRKNPDWVPWPLLSSRLSFPPACVTPPPLSPGLLIRRRPSPGQLGQSRGKGIVFTAAGAIFFFV